MESQHGNKPRYLQFNGLPLELRDHTWELTLPNRRVFHAKEVSSQKPNNEPTKREMCFRFHIRHHPPSALNICTKSRNVAMRHGVFLSPCGDEPGVWFRPETDILYFDREQCKTIQVNPYQPRITVSGRENVLNIGIEWRVFFLDSPRPSQGETTSSYWRAAIGPLHAYMPHMRTVNHALPMLRHEGNMKWGREPPSAPKFQAKLVPLPESIKIPWESARDLYNSLRRIGGLPVATVTWKEVKEDIERGFEEDKDGEENGESSRGLDQGVEHYPPMIVGWWLLREGIPAVHENPLFQYFST
ncbi:hypothetical protein FZEAL_5614 [Fusarium zealandicum]|uniref:2EXR domain-containing protein n=1 Tax=Fusarium zealandicum TaxID=1053134 RepID=A0A8H4UJD2_9HYPO|nr:hypothetical protein FZEAL_5614 [Fusarium zealandicum]